MVPLSGSQPLPQQQQFQPQQQFQQQPLPQQQFQPQFQPQQFQQPRIDAPLSELQAVLCQPLTVPLLFNISKRFKDSQGNIVNMEEFSANFLNSVPTQRVRYLKRVHIELVNNNKIKIEHGAMHYMEGKLTLDAKITGTSLTQGVRPEIYGIGNIWMQSSYYWFVVVDLNHIIGNQIVVEHGFFWACQGTVGIKSKRISVKGSTMGDSNLIHTKLTGSGWVILRIPCPEAGIHRVVLNNTKLSCEGQHDVIFRSNKVKYSAEFAGKGFFQKALNTSNEGILRTYTGVGEVWLMPTIEMFCPEFHQHIHERH